MVDFMFLAIFMLVSFCNHNVTQYCICFLSHFWINLALNEVFEYDYFTKLVFLIEGLFRLLNHHIFDGYGVLLSVAQLRALIFVSANFNACILMKNCHTHSLTSIPIWHSQMWFYQYQSLRFFFFNHSHFLFTGWALCWNCGFFYWIYFHINIRCEFFCAACVLMLFPSSSSGLIWYIF